MLTIFAVPTLSVTGAVVCRYTGQTSGDVNYYTCTELANRYGIPVELFFTLNPNVDRDCRTIKPNTSYCVKGFLEQPISADGKCGLEHGNTTCIGTDKLCCNRETWKCGATLQDCEAGTCYSGACRGFPSQYSTNGKCGKQSNGLLCGGKWGNCCNTDGHCGAGETFCGIGKCQSGSCTIIIPTPRLSAPKLPPTKDGVSTNGACGGSGRFKCDGSTYGDCCSSSGFCGKGISFCAQGCQRNFSSACLTTSIPSLNGECGQRKGGFSCTGGPFDGECCSSDGYCGNLDGYCRLGCQTGFGKCL
ncbi:hypothetical protein EJ08DRAFT_650705 [Tothia fuscella]|uniref:Carbohydrate-binding module family 18 protein n=1 Tax=Tothia fuscella TaxID=1048955 RepID=A0A9P4NPI3_9PEZI|nr:hypothetical protein EJ08DRAFT_650705 [Tothia fuscella]